MAQHMNAAVDEDAALLQFPKEFENAETLLISEVYIIYYLKTTHLTTEFNNPTSILG